VERDGFASVGGAQPQSVRGDGPDLAHLDQRRELVPHLIEREEGLGGVTPIDEQLGLQLIAAARRVIEPKCGNRSYQRPTAPSCRVAAAGSSPRIGWRSTVAGCAPYRPSGSSTFHPGSTRDFTQTWSIVGPRQPVKKLTLSAIPAISSNRSQNAAIGRSS
jgi:hypothetical protein